MKEVTSKQNDVLLFIKEYIATNGYPPSARDIAGHFFISIRSAWDHVCVLEKKGYITITKKIARGIKVNDNRS